MLGKLFDAVFGCSHSRYSFPLSVHAGGNPAAAKRTYVACLECGKEMPYDWENMAIVRTAAKAHRYPHSLMTNQTV